MKKNLLFLLCLSVFFACNTDDAEMTQVIPISKTDLLGTWELLYPIDHKGYNEDGVLIDERDLYLPHTFTADGRFTVDEVSLHTRAPNGDYEVDSLLGEIRFYSDPIYISLDDEIEIKLQDSYHFKTWTVQSMEDDQLFIEQRDWFKDLDGMITEADSTSHKAFVKVD